MTTAAEPGSRVIHLGNSMIAASNAGALPQSNPRNTTRFAARTAKRASVFEPFSDVRLILQPRMDLATN